ncbi:MAG TPA: Uma2 family endonuclease [Acetobacteraceae bacterium]|nr:Uma2 family endonuclease [Acetobacteraceae bacterium]
MSQPNVKPLTFEEFLRWESGQEYKHEFVDGQIAAMAGGTVAHNIIQANLIAAAAPKLRGSGCRPFPSDMLVRTGNGRGRYPDVTIDCGTRREQDLVAPDPRVVFEVLSPETQRRDRTLKLADYNATPSIAHYVLIEQGEPLAHVYSRGPHGDFNLHPEEVRGLDSVIRLPAVGIMLTMQEVYEGLEFGAAPDNPTLVAGPI